VDTTVGTTATRSYTVTRDMITAFNASVGYEPPETGDDARLVARGMLAATLLTRTLDEEIEQAHVFLTQSFKFRGPVYEGDTITAVLAVDRAPDGLVGLSFTLTNQDDEQVMLGEVTLQLV